MNSFSPSTQQHGQSLLEDMWVFGWDPTPGIVSVWAHRNGHAIVWRREGDQVRCETERFRPWLLAATLDDLVELGRALLPSTAPDAQRAAVTYQELDGPSDSYRYLLSASDGGALERAILHGATRRRRQRVNMLGELQDSYYRVGTVEQYLIQTGRVYFRGLVYESVHRLQFDLETTALDPGRGRIFLVAIRDSRGFSATLEAPSADDEARLIADLCRIIRERDPDVIENHNLFGFDLPFLEQRASTLGVPLILGRQGGPALIERSQETLTVGPEARRRTRYSIPGRELIDTLDAVRRYDFVMRDLPSYRLKEVARYFGLATPQRVYLEGTTLFETYCHDPNIVRRYALDDVTEVDGLSQRLLGASFALAGMAPRRYERVASAGPAMGILEPLLVRAYVHAAAALPCYQRVQATEPELYIGGAVHLFASGVAEHVIKADVASLYPSLMRTFQIGPASDRMGVLLGILGRLTDLRLAHKAIAQAAAPGSHDANHHGATQVAMKIVINAAYGYMGAGSIALFADSRAAAEVTQQGRTILTRVLAALQARGMALIEADTDGVYIAVPANWSQEQERALVAEVAAQLPRGINLEYEGRYRAMFSHEVKNYALLTYDGRLIVHGVALRSSRAEPFGERFLRRALHATLLGDVPMMRQAFLETVSALRSRSLPASDLGTRVRLSKTPQAYLDNRAMRQEPAYEALLAAGRTHWTQGERVRFYRTKDKGYIWLPDETDETSIEQRGTPTSAVGGQEEVWATSTQQDSAADRRDYNVEHYLKVLVSSYAARLRKAYEPGDFTQLFSIEQPGLFDRPIEEIQPRWIRCQSEAQ